MAQILIFLLSFVLVCPLRAYAQDTAPADTESPARFQVEPMTIIGESEDMSRIGGSAHVVTEEKLEEQEYNDIHRILRAVPGVYARDEDGFGLRPNIGIRGASSDRSAKVTLLEDGILFGPAPYSAPAAYYFPLSTRMVAVEVFKGPAAVQHGPNTIGGAINLVTRPIPSEATAAIDAEAGQYDTYKIHAWAGDRIQNFGLLAEVVHLETSGFKNLDGGGDSGFTRNEVMLKGDYHWAGASLNNMITALKLGYSDEGSDETYLGISDDDFGQTPNRRYAASQGDRMTWERWQYELSHYAEITSNLDVRATAYRHDFHRIWRKLNRFEQGAPDLRDIFANPTGVNAVYLSVLRGDIDSTTPLETLLVGTNDRTFVSQGVQVVSRWKRPTGPLQHGVEGGVRFHYDEIERDHTEDPFRMMSGHMTPTDEPTRQVLLNKGRAFAVAMYLRDEIEWGRFTLTPGLRFESIITNFNDYLPSLSGGADSFSRDTQNVVIPGIGGTAQIIDGWSALAGVHRGFSPVAPGQSSSVDPEDSINYEAGFRYLGTYLSGIAIGFYNDYDNMVATCRAGSGCDPEQIDEQFNAGGVEVWGAEFLLDSEPELGWQFRAPLSLSYTLTQSRFRDTFSDPVLGDVEPGDELPYVPNHQVSASIGLRRDPFGVSTTLTYLTEQRDVAGEGRIPDNERIDDYFIADLFAFWDFNARGRLYLGIDNVADNAYIVSRRPFGARPGKPFQVMGGVKFELGG